MSGDLTDGALSDALTALEVAAIKPAKPINLPASALYYATRLGFPVFPLKARGKTPLLPKAHPDDEKLQKACRRACGRDGHGLYDATTDEARIRKWWTDHPTANIGLTTGPLEEGGIGLDVIDADGPEGVKAWIELKHRNCPPGCSTEAFCDATGGFDIRCEAFTPGNADVGKGPGRHVFVPATPGAKNGTRLGERPIDIRASGGYVVAVPSLNLLGAAYTWVNPPRPAS